MPVEIGLYAVFLVFAVGSLINYKKIAENWTQYQNENFSPSNRNSLEVNRILAVVVLGCMVGICITAMVVSWRARGEKQYKPRTGAAFNSLPMTASRTTRP